MLKRILPYLLLLIFALALWLRNNRHSGQRRKEDTRRETAFERNVGQLQYTRHARCRMSCREITEAEVTDILQHGTINLAKTDTGDMPCPTYALEGYTLQDHQHVRIVFAQCDRVTKVVTCIDLDKEYTCNCP